MRNGGNRETILRKEIDSRCKEIDRRSPPRCGHCGGWLRVSDTLKCWAQCEDCKHRETILQWKRQLSAKIRKQEVSRKHGGN